MVDTISNMQLDGLNSKTHGGKSIRRIIDRAIGIHFYLPSGYEHYNLLCMNRFHISTHRQVQPHDKTDEKTELYTVRNFQSV